MALGRRKREQQALLVASHTKMNVTAVQPRSNRRSRLHSVLQTKQKPLDELFSATGNTFWFTTDTDVEVSVS
ncbi:MAG: hypothetical protein IH895_01055 [Planctomycetes bacterium]|nr:hypothetical protein [Planctomycetota bacterium]